MLNNIVFFWFLPASELVLILQSPDNLNDALRYWQTIHPNLVDLYPKCTRFDPLHEAEKFIMTNEYSLW
jgi:hypothetical protein